MDSSVIPVVLVHRASSRVSAIGQRISLDYTDVTIVSDVATIDEVAADVTLAGTIVLTDDTDHDGTTVVERVRRIREVGARVIVLGSDDTNAVVRVMAAGADSVVQASSSTRRVVEQLRLVANRARLMASRAAASESVD